MLKQGFFVSLFIFLQRFNDATQFHELQSTGNVAHIITAQGNHRGFSSAHLFLWGVETALVRLDSQAGDLSTPISLTLANKKQ